MSGESKALGYVAILDQGFDQARASAVEALKAEGFGVLTEINVQETLKNKLGVDVPAHRILGACNPKLAHRALSAAPQIGLLLPCNVTVRQLEDGKVEVSLVDPLLMLGVAETAELGPVAEEAAARLQRVRDALAQMG